MKTSPAIGLSLACVTIFRCGGKGQPACPTATSARSVADRRGAQPYLLALTIASMYFWWQFEQES
jgi:hypothetical protein